MPFIADEIQPNLRTLKKRLGRFSVTMFLVGHHPEAVRTALEGCVIVRAEAIYHTGTIDYVAMHNDFEVVPDDESPPLYLCHITQHDDFSISRVWRKVPG